MKIHFTKAPTFTKAIIAAAVFAITYLATTSNLPSCSDTAAVLSAGACIERQSFLHTASGWLALICLVAAVVLLALKHKDSILGRQPAAPQAQQGPQWPAPAVATAPQAQEGPQWPAPAAVAATAPVATAPVATAPAPAAERASSFCAKCGTRILAGDRFCQGCGVSMGSPR